MSVVEHDNIIKTTRNGNEPIRRKKPIVIHRDPLKSSNLLKLSHFNISEKAGSLEDEEEYDTPNLNNEQKETTLDSHSTLDTIQQPKQIHGISRQGLISLNLKNNHNNNNDKKNNTYKSDTNNIIDDHRRVSSSSKRNLRIELGKPLPLSYSPIISDNEMINNGNFNDSKNKNPSFVSDRQKNEIPYNDTDQVQKFQKDRNLRIRKLRASIDHERLKRYSTLTYSAENRDTFSQPDDIDKNISIEKEEIVDTDSVSDPGRLERQKELKSNILQLRKYKYQRHNQSNLDLENTVKPNVIENIEDKKVDEDINQKIQEKKGAVKELDKLLEELRNELKAEEIIADTSAIDENIIDQQITATITNDLTTSSLKIDDSVDPDYKIESKIEEEKDDDVSELFNNVVVSTDSTIQQIPKSHQIKETKIIFTKKINKWTTLVVTFLGLICILSYFASD